MDSIVENSLVSELEELGIDTHKNINYYTAICLCLDDLKYERLNYSMLSSIYGVSLVTLDNESNKINIISKDLAPKECLELFIQIIKDRNENDLLDIHFINTH